MSVFIQSGTHVSLPAATHIPVGTYTAGQLLFDIIPRIGNVPPTGISLFGAANSITNLIFSRLLERRSDLLATGGISAIVPAGGYSFTLPGDFLSPAEKPYSFGVENMITSMLAQLTTAGLSSGNLAIINAMFAGYAGVLVSDIQSIVTGQLLSVSVQDIISSLITSRHRHSLQPCYLDDDEDGHELGWWDLYGISGGITGTSPHTMKIINQTMFARPKSCNDVTIRGRYFQRPGIVNVPTDVIPFNSMFDEVYREGSVKILVTGLAMPETDAGFAAFMRRVVDTIIDSRVHPVRSNGRVARRNWT